jgi:callose synthase
MTRPLFPQGLHAPEWRNFAERMRLPPPRLTPEAVTADPMLSLHVRLWASRRGQTLARTVFGMMHYEAALGFLATLEHGAAAMPRHSAAALARRKVRYVCACQVYGEYLRTGDPRARDIEALLHAFPSMRVAYVDRKSGGAHLKGVRCEAEWAAVLVRSDGRGGLVCECRIELPGDPILGEGKPENQNVSLPFCHGEYVQLIDMNQEGYWEEALKMRPLLREFRSSSKRGPVTIVGFPEHVFTQSSGFVTAIFMGLQERATFGMKKKKCAGCTFYPER